MCSSLTSKWSSVDIISSFEKVKTIKLLAADSKDEELFSPIFIYFGIVKING